MSLKMRRIRTSAIAVAGVCVAALLFNTPQLRDQLQFSSLDRNDHSDSALSTAIVSPVVCEPTNMHLLADEWESSNVYSGEWKRIPPERRLNYEQFSKRWGSHYPGCVTPAYELGPWDHNGPGGNRTRETTNQESERGHQRVVEVMSWEWHPLYGKLREWDPTGFVVRALNSRAGFMISGGEYIS